MLVADAFTVGELKTKAFLKLLGEQISGEFKNVLIVAPQFDETTYKAARNVAHAQLATASDVNSEQLLRYDKILVTRDALAKFAERTGAAATE